MIEALLKGKLSRQQENMEDILTSIVLGSMKYFPPEKALMPFLSKAILASGERPFEDIDIVSAKYKFWPQINENNCYACEPDAIITLLDKSKNKTIIMVEAKYQSGKSSYKDESDKPNDQLAREWSNLYRIANKYNANPYLLYLTADFGYPFDEINESQKELIQKNENEAQICWLSWRHFSLIDFNDIELLSDISNILRYKYNLLFFENISINHINTILWRFIIDFNWSINIRSISWKFQSKI